MAGSNPEPSDPRNRGALYPLILDHVLSYPGTYEIPLRTMYTLNSTPRAQPLPQHLKQAVAASSNGGRETPSDAQQDAGLQFTSSLMSQISQLPSQPCSLPPSFINSFVRRCFTVELELVDFPQSLTGLDYLKDLECRRRREAVNAFGRLGLDPAKLDEDLEKVGQQHPAVKPWVRSIRDKEKKVEALYTQIYIGLRRWILINELQLAPFNKHNCVAMLNTLYPPAISHQPTTQLTPTVLKQQRDGWFRYITAVEQNGTAVLSNLTNQGRRPGDTNGWPALRSTLDMYLRSATVVIAECSDVRDLSHFEAKPTATSAAGAAALEDDSSNNNAAGNRKRGRKADSGVSFDRPSTSGSNKTTAASKADPVAALPAPPVSPSSPSAKVAATNTAAARRRASAHETIAPTPKASSALERLAREFRRLKARKATSPSNPSATSGGASGGAPTATVDDSAIAAQQRGGASKKHATLRKMRSLGAMGEGARKAENARYAGEGGGEVPGVPMVDREVMKRETERARRERERSAGVS
ncbi:MAG: hypothetical protein M1822_007388 [Bathelium mastoideum]|nr:MAG: hypothetical protein M1822_007388 [Bathelium mastoideum]